MKKNIIIIISVAIIAVTITIVLIYFRSGNKPAVEVEENQQASELPVGETGTKIPNVLPESKIKDTAIRVEDASNPDQTKTSFENYVNQSASDFPNYVKDGISQDFPLSDKEGKLVNLDIFLQSVDANINSKLRNIIGSNYYGFFYCPNQEGAKEYGVVFDVGSGDPEKLQSENVDVKKIMLEWEPYMLKDLHNIIFPKTNFAGTDLEQSLIFKDGEFRYAEINMPNGKKSIDYIVHIDKGNSINRIYITTSQECLKKSLNYLFDF